MDQKTNIVSDLDWEGLSQDFAVDLQFLLMQAAWLSERHMERMKKQVARIAQGDGPSSSGTGSAVGGLKMERGGSRGMSRGVHPRTGSIILLIITQTQGCQREVA